MISANLTQKNNDKYLTLSLRLLIFFAIPFMFGLLSLFLGRDINWDLKNYHYYNAYAFVEHRLDFDIAPAQLQTFFNPLADLPFYFMTKFFPSWVAGFVLGFVHGFNLSLLLLIFWKIANYSNKWLQLLLGVCLVIVSGIAPMFISELGNTMHDNLTSLFVLSAVFLLMTASEKFENGERRLGLFLVGWAGVIMGLGVGFKPSIIIFAISSAIVFVLFMVARPNKLAGIFVYGLAGITGGLISVGFWDWSLWVRFGNPLFPYYNHIFKSPYFTSSPVQWSSFLPKEVWEYFAWPFIFTVNSYRTNQLHFFDIRFALFFILSIAWLIVSIVKRYYPMGHEVADDSTGKFHLKLGNCLLLFFLFSYVLWIKESATYRFMIPLELLVPLCFLIILERIVRSEKLQIIFVLGAVLATFSFFKPFNWGRLDWSDPYIKVDTSRLDTSANAVVVMLGSSPMAYVIPQLPSNYRFIRPEGNLGMQASDNNPFVVKIRKVVKEHKGPLYILYNKDEKKKSTDLEKSMAQWGMNLNFDSCFILQMNIPDNLVMCQAFSTAGN